MKEFRVSPSLTGSECKSAIEIASMLGLDTAKQYVGPIWVHHTECWHYFGLEKLTPNPRG